MQPSCNTDAGLESHGLKSLETLHASGASAVIDTIGRVVTCNDTCSISLADWRCDARNELSMVPLALSLTPAALYLSNAPLTTKSSPGHERFR